MRAYASESGEFDRGPSENRGDVKKAAAPEGAAARSAETLKCLLKSQVREAAARDARGLLGDSAILIYVHA